MTLPRTIYVRQVPAIPHPKLQASENLTDFDEDSVVGVYKLEDVEYLTISKRLEPVAEKK